MLYLNKILINKFGHNFKNGTITSLFGSRGIDFF